MTSKKKDWINNNQIFTRLGIATLAILSIPLFMMQVSSEWNWGVFDFILIGLLIFGAGSLFIIIARKTPRKHRLIIGLSILGLLILTYVHLAVGLVNSWPLAGS